MSDLSDVISMILWPLSFQGENIKGVVNRTLNYSELFSSLKFDHANS